METLVVKISPCYDSSKLQNASLEDLIDVFEDRLFGWHLNWAESLNKEEHAGFAVLQLAFTYFEAIKIYQTGIDSRGNSKTYFKDSLQNVFPDLSQRYGNAIIGDAVELIYEDARCGFYHSGMAKKRIILHDGEKAIRFDVNGNEVIAIRIDRYKFVQSIKDHAADYISQLRDSVNMEVRDNFKNGWDIFHR